MYLLLSTPPSIGNLFDAHKTDLPTDSHRWAATREETELADRCTQLKRTKAKLSILLLSVPFVGHVAPLLALGEELVCRGHAVSLCALVTEGVPNKPEGMVRRAGISFINAGPPSFAAQQLVTDEAFKMWVVESEGFLSRAFRVSNLTVGENIVMARHLSNMTGDGILLVDSLDIVKEWNIYIPSLLAFRRNGMSQQSSSTPKFSRSGTLFLTGHSLWVEHKLMTSLSLSD